MTLYDIDAEILKIEQKASEILDEETGEVTDIDEFESLKAQFDALQMDRKQKISNIACLYKQTLAEAEAIKTEKMALAKRQQATENRAESLKRYVVDTTESTETADSTETIENTESTESTEATESTESTENTEATESTEATENTEATESIDATEDMTEIEETEYMEPEDIRN